MIVLEVHYRLFYCGKGKIHFDRPAGPDYNYWSLYRLTDHYRYVFTER